jgi:hypothetical protein
MVEQHLSPLVLDTVAAGLPYADSARVHLGSCESCRGRLEAVKSERAATMQSSRFAAGLRRASPSPVPRLRWAPKVAGFAIAACLSLIIGSRLVSKHEEGGRLKGQVTVEVLQGDSTPVGTAKVGDQVSLAVGGAGFSQVAVFAISADGAVTLLESSMPLAPGARVPVGKLFEVTPGSLLLFACFDDRPLPIDALREQLTEGAVRQLKQSGSALETPAPSLEHGACARTRLEVAP